MDVAALAGFHGGSVSYDNTETSTGFGYGIYAPLGVQVAEGRFGLIGYPVDLGAYLSGSPEEEQPEIRLQSALHAGFGIYWRISSRTPIVVGGSAEYKPQFDDEDSKEFRVSFTLIS